MTENENQKVENIADQLKNAVLERISGDFTGPFLLFFFSFNWRVLVLLFWNNGDAKNRIQSVEALHQSFWITIRYPFFMTTAYVLLMPFFTHMSALYRSFFQQREAGMRILDKIELDELNDYGVYVRNTLSTVANRINGALASIKQAGKLAQEADEKGDEKLKSLMIDELARAQDLLTGVNLDLQVSIITRFRDLYEYFKRFFLKLRKV